MDILLKVAGANARQAMNAKNEDGDTPLMMVAARSAVSGVLMHKPFGPPMKPLGIRKEIMERGADKSITDETGLTALGFLRKYAMKRMKFVGGYQTAMDMVEPISRLLIQTKGPTRWQITQLYKLLRWLHFVEMNSMTMITTEITD